MLRGQIGCYDYFGCFGDRMSLNQGFGTGCGLGTAAVRRYWVVVGWVCEAGAHAFRPVQLQFFISLFLIAAWRWLRPKRTNSSERIAHVVDGTCALMVTVFTNVSV